MTRFTDEERIAQKKLIRQLYDRYYMNPILRVIQERETKKGEEHDTQTDK